MIEKIKSLVLEECKDKEWDWKAHVEAVVKYSKSLARELGADQEVCEISAWLHDIIKIRGGTVHHVKGAEEARRILQGFGFPEEKIRQIEHCIITHSSDQNHIPKSLEAKILASADALSHFDSFLGLAMYALVLKNESVEMCKNTLLEKYENSWDKLLVPHARQMAKPKYEAIRLILQ